MSVQEHEEMAENEQKRRIQAQQLAEPADEMREGETAEILRYLSQIDDLPIGKEDKVLGQLVSKLTSTANLSAEQVRSNEWVFEYILILYLASKPTKDGVHSSDRAWSHDDVDAYRDPLDAEDRLMIESFVSNSKLALTRSEDMAVVKEGTRTVKESIVNDEGNGGDSSGGILGRLRS